MACPRLPAHGRDFLLDLGTGSAAVYTPSDRKLAQKLVALKLARFRRESHTPTYSTLRVEATAKGRRCARGRR